MVDTPEPNDKEARYNLASEFHNLGENLKKIFIEAWESEERRKFQMEIEEGLSDLGDSLKQTAKEINDSETGQKVKAEAEDLRDRIQSGEVADKIHQDLLSVLKKVNAELEKAVPSEPSSSETDVDGPGN
jgi:hypothetical protein